MMIFPTYLFINSVPVGKSDPWLSMYAFTSASESNVGLRCPEGARATNSTLLLFFC